MGFAKNQANTGAEMYPIFVRGVIVGILLHKLSLRHDRRVCFIAHNVAAAKQPSNFDEIFQLKHNWQDIFY